MNRRILLVDDEQDVLDSFKRQLRKKFYIETALNGFEGLKLITSSEPFAVIVSDYQMPSMNGIQFLKSVKQKAPDSVRVMLTGNADIDMAINAVNHGQIFRFLTKPCSVDLFIETMQSGIELYRLITAEKELLEKTLSGSIKVLSEILSLVNPTAFGKAIRIKNCVNHIVSKLNIPSAWQFEIASLLSLIGFVTIPTETLNKLYLGMPLSEIEDVMIKKHPEIARNLLVNIPRLGTVARMIESQRLSYTKVSKSDDFHGEDMVALGGNLLKIAMDFDKLLMQGESQEKAIKELIKQPNSYYIEAVRALRSFRIRPFGEVEKTIIARELKTNMILNEDILAKNGALIAIKGQDVSDIMLKRLQAFAKSVGINEPFEVIEKCN